MLFKMPIPDDTILRHIFGCLDQNNSGLLHDSYVLDSLIEFDQKQDSILPKKEMLKEWVKTSSGLVDETDFITM